MGKLQPQIVAQAWPDKPDSNGHERSEVKWRAGLKYPMKSKD